MIWLQRREFITLLGGAVAAWPLAARAQQAAKLPTVGFPGATTPSAQSQWTDAFVQRLRELGWIEGRTIAVEYRWTEGRTERAAEIAAEFVQRKVDVIVTSGTAMVWPPSRRRRSSPSSSRRLGTQSAPAWSPAWRDRAATSPACRTRYPILLASASPRHFMWLSTHSPIPTGVASIPWRWLSGCRRCTPFGKGRSGGSDVLWTKHPGPIPARG